MTADLEIHFNDKGNGSHNRLTQLAVKGLVTFEITNTLRNPRITKEVQIVSLPNSLYK